MDKPLTVTERKAIERKKKKDAGLVRVEVWVHESKKDEIKRLAEDLNK
jgi:hypothetical protein